MSTMSAFAQMQIRRLMAQAALGDTGKKTMVIGGQSDTGLPPAEHEALMRAFPPRPARRELDFATIMGFHLPGGGQATVPMGAGVIEQIRSIPDAQSPLERRNPAEAKGRNPVETKGRNNRNSLIIPLSLPHGRVPADIAPPPQATATTLPVSQGNGSGPNITAPIVPQFDPTAPIAPQFDPTAPIAPQQTRELIDYRAGFRGADAALREARMRGITGDQLTPFEQRRAFYQQGLADQNRARNAEHLAGITPEQRAANAQALQDQIPGARMSVAESLGAFADSRLAASERFPNNRTNQIADEASRLFADSVQNINAPIPQFTPSATTQDQFAQRASDLRSSLQNRVKPEEVAALEARQNMTPDEFMAFRFQQASIDRAIAEQEAAAAVARAGGGGVDEGRVYASMLGFNVPQDATLPSDVVDLMKDAAIARLRETIDDAKQQGQDAAVLNDPPSRAKIISVVNAFAKSLKGGNEGDFKAADDIFNQMTPEEQRVTKDAILQKMEEMGIGPVELRERPPGLSKLIQDWLVRNTTFFGVKSPLAMGISAIQRGNQQDQAMKNQIGGIVFGQ